MALVTLTGGNFQDSKGVVLAAGFLTFSLSHDELDPGTGTQIAAGLVIKVVLDNNGSAAAGQSVWATDVLLPTNAFYTVEAFNSNGELAWKSPQFVTIPSGSSYNLGNLIPNQPVPQPIPSIITLQTNGVTNSNQLLENLVAGANITLVNSAGATTINAVSGGATFASAGSGFFFSWQGLPGTVTGTGGSFTGGGATGVIFCTKITLLAAYTVRKITTQMSSLVGGNASCAIYSDDGTTKLIDAGSSAFNTGSGSIQTVTLGSPVSIGPGQFWFAMSTTGNGANAELTVSLASPGAPLLNQNVTRCGTSANSYAGSMPSSLGVITASTPTSTLAGFLFEV